MCASYGQIDGGIMFGALSIAEIGIVSCFCTNSFVRYVIDPAHWSRCVALVAQLQALSAFRKLARLNDCLLRLPLAEQRTALTTVAALPSCDTQRAASPGDGPPRECWRWPIAYGEARRALPDRAPMTPPACDEAGMPPD